MQKSSGSVLELSVVTVHRNETKRKPLNSDDDVAVHRTQKKCQSGSVLELSVVTVHRNQTKRNPLNSDDDVTVHRTPKKCHCTRMTRWHHHHRAPW